jgi:hypothetical protein
MLTPFKQFNSLRTHLEAMFPNQSLKSEVENDEMTNEFYLRIWRSNPEKERLER